MKVNNYNIEKIIDGLYSRGFTNFVNQVELMNVKGKLNRNEYHILEFYDDCNKVILYKNKIPNISLLKIISPVLLRHQDILGNLFSLGLSDDVFGDIIKYHGEFYFFVLPNMVEYLKYNFNQIKGNMIRLEEVDFELSKEFRIEYKKMEIIVSSLRIDNIVSTLINSSRNDVLEKFKNKDIILNYSEDVKPTRVLRENDVFSIRKYGKFKYSKVLKETKKGGFIIEILKYL